jgi:hypothetical protein
MEIGILSSLIIGMLVVWFFLGSLIYLLLKGSVKTNIQWKKMAISMLTSGVILYLIGVLRFF